jgi:hypothetical protein
VAGKRGGGEPVELGRAHAGPDRAAQDFEGLRDDAPDLF